jgi:hypothetical protein
MASSTHKMSYHDLGVLIRNVGTFAQEAQKKAVFEAAFHMKDVITDAVESDLRMQMKKTKSGHYRSAKAESNKVGVRFDVKGVINPTALLSAYGPMGLLEYGAKKHQIIARNQNLANMRRGKAKQRMVQQRELDITAGTKGAFSGSRPLNTPEGPRWRVMNHPGARPKKTFSRSVERATPKATEIATSLIRTKTIQRLRTQYGTFTYVLGEQGVFRPVVG